MTRAERHALLGPTVIAHIHDRAKAAPEPTPELIEELRRIMTRPAGRVITLRPAVDAAA